MSKFSSYTHILVFSIKVTISFCDYLVETTVMFEISTIQSEAVTVYISTDNKMHAGNEF